jgi:kumamolisin
VTVALKLRHPHALDAFLRAVRDPSSPLYHQFLTPQEFVRLYGPSPATVARVEAYLRSQGFSVTGVSRNLMLVHARATTEVVERAFSVSIGDYVHGALRFYAASSDPRLPPAVAADVQAVLGLDDAPLFRPMLVPNTKVSAQSTPSGYSPEQIATAYDWPSITNTQNGAGVVIANATAESSNLSTRDLDTFWNTYGLPTHTVNVIDVDGSSTSTSGTIETTIDEERSGAMAPGATLDVYDAASATDSDFTDTYNTIVNDNTAQVVTTSWGEPESDASSSTLTADDNIFKQAAAQGMSVFAAAGDNGSSDGTSNPDTADYPASDPYVVACGGTELTLNSNNTIASETAWSDSGGAVSSVFSEPSWQVGNGVPQNGYRNTSDIALDADPNTGYSVYEGGSWSVYGGTSFVAPQMAALIAVKDSETGTRLGQANVLIYNDANSSNYATDFNDITSGSNGAFSAGPGWNHPTGWGSVQATNLIAHLGGGGTTTVPAPTAQNGSVTTTENQAVSGTLSASASGNPALTFQIVAQPADGTVTITDASTGAFTYTPNSGFTGTDSFTFDASDSGGTSNTATETVTVNAPAVPAPTAQNGSVTTTENQAVSGTLSASASGNPALTFQIVAQPADGTVTITDASTGAFTYTPNSGFTGTDSFTFDASDSGGTSNTATETVTVNPAQSGPCPAGYTSYTGSVSNGNYDYQPNENYYYANAGNEDAQITSPAGTNFDLYLYEWNDFWGWIEVAASQNGGNTQSVSYPGNAGYYIWVIYANVGGGNYSFCLSQPGPSSAARPQGGVPSVARPTPVPASASAMSSGSSGSGALGLPSLGLLLLAAIALGTRRRRRLES